ncbi:MAG: J domain-containing protein [Bryobacteraceae bacterium]|nr:J domain-containing protein [Bryobacteraceae bacterium]
MAMPADQTPERRRKSRNSRVPPVEVKLRPLDGSGGGWLSTVLVDTAEAGIGIQGRYPVQVGIRVLLDASEEMKSALGPLPPHGRVAWSRRTNSGLYRFGVAFELPGATPEDPGVQAAILGDGSVDYYELLQVHPKANGDMINRAYRLLAQIYHPDNQSTGDESKFRQLVAAYKILSDEAARAAYDLARNTSLKSIWSVFKNSPPVTGLAGERRKRQGILAALFQKRAADPHTPTLTVFELEDVLSVNREQVEFTLWYLRERTFVIRSDDNRFQITAQGVDALEKMELESDPGSRYFEDRELPLLPAPKRA